MSVTYYEVHDSAGRLRFASLLREPTIRHARAVNGQEGGVCAVTESEREPVDHRSRNANGT